MDKKYKIILYIAGFLLALVIIVVIFRNLSSPSSTSQNNPNPGTATSTLPDYILQNEPDVRKFVENFVILYNTYSYGDYSNLTALGDYQTPEMQQKTLDLISHLQNSTAPGYSIVSKTDDSTFSYTYPQADQLFVSIKGPATESAPGGGVNYIFTAKLSLEKSGTNWLVSNITYTKN